MGYTNNSGVYYHMYRVQINVSHFTIRNTFDRTCDSKKA